MEIFFSILGVLLWSGFALLDTTLSSNADLGTALSLHFLQTVTTRTDEETEEVDLGKLLNGDVDLLRRTLRPLHLMILDGGPEVGVILHSTIHKPDALLLEFLPVANLAGVSTATVCIIGGRRRRRPVSS